jgi:dTDP-4-amino-4,6-dideoxygalactose transaminase
MYYILVAEGSMRPGLLSFLNDRGINAVSHYVPLHSAPAGRRFGRVAGTLDVTDSVAERIVRLPLWPDMTADETSAVTDAVKQWAAAPERV